MADKKKPKNPNANTALLNKPFAGLSSIGQSWVVQPYEGSLINPKLPQINLRNPPVPSAESEAPVPRTQAKEGDTRPYWDQWSSYQVKNAQEYLNQFLPEGKKLTIDGIAGKNTQKALVWFEKEYANKYLDEKGAMKAVAAKNTLPDSIIRPERIASYAVGYADRKKMDKVTVAATKTGTSANSIVSDSRDKPFDLSTKLGGASDKRQIYANKVADLGAKLDLFARANPKPTKEKLNENPELRKKWEAFRLLSEYKASLVKALDDGRTPNDPSISAEEHPKNKVVETPELLAAERELILANKPKERNPALVQAGTANNSFGVLRAVVESPYATTFGMEALFNDKPLEVQPAASLQDILGGSVLKKLGVKLDVTGKEPTNYVILPGASPEQTPAQTQNKIGPDGVPLASVKPPAR